MINIKVTSQDQLNELIATGSPDTLVIYTGLYYLALTGTQSVKMILTGNASLTVRAFHSSRADIEAADCADITGRAFDKATVKIRAYEHARADIVTMNDAKAQLEAYDDAQVTTGWEPHIFRGPRCLDC